MGKKSQEPTTTGEGGYNLQRKAKRKTSSEGRADSHTKGDANDVLSGGLGPTKKKKSTAHQKTKLVTPQNGRTSNLSWSLLKPLKRAKKGSLRKRGKKLTLTKARKEIKSPTPNNPRSTLNKSNLDQKRKKNSVTPQKNHHETNYTN